MQGLEDIQQYITKSLSGISYPAQPQNLYQPIKYILSLGGKRLRPALLLLSNQLFDGNSKEAIHAALAVEVFHNFTLLHDDIMDNAPLRRGKPTVHEKWNRNVAILSGDVMLVEAYKLLSKIPKDKLEVVLNTFNTMAVEVCQGQQMDMDFESHNDVTIPEYIEMIRLKTSVLLGASLKMGALLANTSKENANAIYNFGVNLGIAFQLQDDFLDSFGDPEKFGKKVGGDIVENKQTFLFIQLKTSINKQDEKGFNQLLAADEQIKIKGIKALYEKYQIPELCKVEINSYYENALNFLDAIDMKDEKKKILQTFALQIMNRES